MKNPQPSIKWAIEILHLKDHSTEILLDTPWSSIIRFHAPTGDFYLKQTPPALFLEPQVIQLLSTQFQANVATIVASNNDLHCFLMQDAGQTLRSYLKKEFQANLLCQAITQFATMQRATEKDLTSFFDLGVPDWRLEKFPILYIQLINQTKLLKSEGLTDKELQILIELTPTLKQQCEELSEYTIPETLVQIDFNTNNILIDPNTKKLTSIDLGEVIIAHPFFALQNYLLQAITHHNVKKYDHIYQQMQQACFSTWLDLISNKQQLKCHTLIEKLWPIYSAFGFYRLMQSVDLQALQIFYSNRPNRLAADLRTYIQFNSLES